MTYPERKQFESLLRKYCALPDKAFATLHIETKWQKGNLVHMVVKSGAYSVNQDKPGTIRYVGQE